VAVAGEIGERLAGGAEAATSALGDEDRLTGSYGTMDAVNFDDPIACDHNDQDIDFVVYVRRDAIPLGEDQQVHAEVVALVRPGNARPGACASERGEIDGQGITRGYRLVSGADAILEKMRPAWRIAANVVLVDHAVSSISSCGRFLLQLAVHRNDSP
jgi:hypothetical protein